MTIQPNKPISTGFSAFLTFAFRNVFCLFYGLICCSWLWIFIINSRSKKLMKLEWFHPCYLLALNEGVKHFVLGSECLSPSWTQFCISGDTGRTKILFVYLQIFYTSTFLSWAITLALLVRIVPWLLEATLYGSLSCPKMVR